MLRQGITLQPVGDTNIVHVYINGDFIGNVEARKTKDKEPLLLISDLCRLLIVAGVNVTVERVPDPSWMLGEDDQPRYEPD